MKLMNAILVVTSLGIAATLVLTMPPKLRAEDMPDEKGYQKLMKEVGKIGKGFKQNVQDKNDKQVAADATRLADIFKEATPFWASRKADDAVKSSQESVEAAQAMAAAAKDGDWDKVRTANQSMGKNCKVCHDAHREKLEGGGFKIK